MNFTIPQCIIGRNALPASVTLDVIRLKGMRADILDAETDFCASYKEKGVLPVQIYSSDP